MSFGNIKISSAKYHWPPIGTAYKQLKIFYRFLRRQWKKYLHLKLWLLLIIIGYLFN